MRTRDEVIDDCEKILCSDAPLPISDAAALKLMVELAGRKAGFHDASQYVFEYGRHLGYDLPDYPLAGCGEIREFLRDQGVRDLPEWYGHIGMDRATYDNIYYYRLLVITDPGYNRQAIPLAISWLDEGWSDDAPLDARELAIYAIRFVRGGIHAPDAVLFR